MIFRKRIFTRAFFSLLFMLTLNLNAQSVIPQVQPNGKQDTVQSELMPIELNEINEASMEAFSLFRNVESKILTEANRVKVMSLTDSLVVKITNYLDDTVGVDLSRLNLRELELLRNNRTFLIREIEDLHDKINAYLDVAQDNDVLLGFSMGKWQLTFRNSDIEITPEALQKRIAVVINTNDSIADLVSENIDFLLTQSDKLTGQQIKMEQFALVIEEVSRIRTSKVFHRDTSPLWQMEIKSDTLGMAHHWDEFRSNVKSETVQMVSEQSGRLILLLFIFFVFFTIVYWIKANVQEEEIQEKTVMLSLYLNEIFRKPFEVALLLGLYMVKLFIPEMPSFYDAILSLILVYAILRIAFDILPANYWRYLIGFSIAFVFFRVYNLFYFQHFTARITLLLTQVVAIFYTYLFLRGYHNSRKLKRSFFNYFLYGMSGLFFVLLLVSTFANILGALSLSEYLTGGIVKSAFLVLTTYVGFHVASALVYLVMSTSTFKKSNIIRKQFRYIYVRLYKILKWLFVISWIFVALENFNVKTIFVDWGWGILTNAISLGEASFTMMNIIMFVFVIWLSMFISRVVRHILHEEVFTRVKVKRGMPGTISMLLQVVFVIVGFLLAAAAAGMQLSSLTIILGAFSVGIGFGLQNIFNNLVSGLILAFERPIKEGDIVEVNTLLGKVKKIGIRSSVVRTFSGAEVIVPNGELISNDLINWTLSDQYRRTDIRVGVAYGTDPELITSMLLDVAKAHAMVNKKPEPEAYFIDFGESSLDFRLLAWVDQDHRLQVESEIRKTIYARLADAGIEIPFPQHDVHMK